MTGRNRNWDGSPPRAWLKASHVAQRGGAHCRKIRSSGNIGDEARRRVLTGRGASCDHGFAATISRGASLIRTGAPHAADFAAASTISRLRRPSSSVHSTCAPARMASRK